MFTNVDLSGICIGALDKAHYTLERLGDSGIKESEKEGERLTRGDLKVSENIIKFLKWKKIPGILYTEESGKIELSNNPRYIITLDDIDGTENYFRGRKILPYCTAMAIFDSMIPRFKDVVAAGIIEHSTNTSWYAIRNVGTFCNGSRVAVPEVEKLDKKTTIVIDNYYEANVKKFSEILRESWIRDHGSSAFHLAGVSSGLFNAFLSVSQKAHELAPGYLLLKEANVFLSDLNGKPLDTIPYSFDHKYPIIAASTEKFGRKILSLLD